MLPRVSFRHSHAHAPFVHSKIRSCPHCYAHGPVRVINCLVSRSTISHVPISRFHLKHAANSTPFSTSQPQSNVTCHTLPPVTSVMCFIRHRALGSPYHRQSLVVQPCGGGSDGGGVGRTKICRESTSSFTGAAVCTRIECGVDIARVCSIKRAALQPCARRRQRSKRQQLMGDGKWVDCCCCWCCCCCCCCCCCGR